MKYIKKIQALENVVTLWDDAREICKNINSDYHLTQAQIEVEKKYEELKSKNIYSDMDFVIGYKGAVLDFLKRELKIMQVNKENELDLDTLLENIDNIQRLINIIWKIEKDYIKLFLSNITDMLDILDIPSEEVENELKERLKG